MIVEVISPLADTAQQEADPTQENPWLLYKGGINEYESTFRQLLDQPLLQYVANLNSASTRPMAMDLMGAGQILRELPPLRAGLAVALGDRRTDSQKQLDGLFGIDMVTGNILEDETWSQIRIWLESNKTTGFHLILCRPMGGMVTITDTEKFFSLLSWSYSVLNDLNGVLFTEAPRFAYRLIAKLEAWADLCSGINIKCSPDKEQLRISRWRGSPPVLPPPILSA